MAGGTVCFDGFVELRIDPPLDYLAANRPVGGVACLHPPTQLSLDHLVHPLHASIRF